MSRTKAYAAQLVDLHGLAVAVALVPLHTEARTASAPLVVASRPAPAGLTGWDLLGADPEVDLEHVGRKVPHVSRVYVTGSGSLPPPLLYVSTWRRPGAQRSAPIAHGRAWSLRSGSRLPHSHREGRRSTTSFTATALGTRCCIDWPTPSSRQAASSSCRAGTGYRLRSARAGALTASSCPAVATGRATPSDSTPCHADWLRLHTLQAGPSWSAFVVVQCNRVAQLHSHRRGRVNLQPSGLAWLHTSRELRAQRHSRAVGNLSSRH